MAVVLGVAGGYVYFNPWVVEPYLKGTPLEVPPRVIRAYKWRDAKGNWQISDRPPPEGTKYETVTVTTDQNVMPLAPKE